MIPLTRSERILVYYTTSFGGSSATKKIAQIPGNAFSDALLMSRVQKKMEGVNLERRTSNQSKMLIIWLTKDKSRNNIRKCIHACNLSESREESNSIRIIDSNYTTGKSNDSGSNSGSNMNSSYSTYGIIGKNQVTVSAGTGSEN